MFGQGGAVSHGVDARQEAAHCLDLRTQFIGLPLIPAVVHGNIRACSRQHTSVSYWYENPMSVLAMASDSVRWRRDSFLNIIVNFFDLDQTRIPCSCHTALYPVVPSTLSLFTK